MLKKSPASQTMITATNVQPAQASQIPSNPYPIRVKKLQWTLHELCNLMDKRNTSSDLAANINILLNELL